MMEYTVYQQMQRYVGWSEADMEALRALLPLARPEVAAIAEEFYERIREFPDALRVLRDEAQVRRLQQTLQRWVLTLLEGPHDQAYFEQRCRIGAVHARIGLPQHFVFTAMSLIRSHLDRLCATMQDAAGRERALQALNRALDLELAMMLETYRESTLERLARIERLERDGLAQKLAAAEERYRDAIETATALILVLDVEGQPLLWNRTAARVTGYERDELLGHAPLELLLPDREAREAVRSVTPEAPATFEATLQTRSGRHHHVRWLVSATTDPEHGGLIRYLIGVDLTDAHEAERRARAAERLATVGTMAAGLAHEIRNPLNAASIHVTLLERTLQRLPQPPPAAVEAAAVLRSEIKRLSTLVNEFLDFARPKPLRAKPAPLCELCAAVIDLLQPDAQHAGVALTFERPHRPVWAEVDAERLKQVLINLIRNAVDATRESPERSVVLRLRRSGATAEIDVEDTGPGIPDGSPIFDAFYTTKESGTGLGLAIVLRIVHDHGGHITVNSHPGCTLFTVHLPGASSPSPA